MTADDLRRILAEKCGVEGQRAWAIAHGVAPSRVNDFLKGRRGPNDAILAALGYVCAFEKATEATGNVGAVIPR